MHAFLKFGDQKLAGELELSESTLAGVFTVKRSLLAAGQASGVPMAACVTNCAGA
jgi:hypothetical protein